MATLIVEPFIAWEEVVRDWSDDDLELALNTPEYATIGEGDKSLHDFVRDEIARRDEAPIIKRKPLSGASRRLKPIDVTATFKTYVPPKPITKKKKRGPQPPPKAVVPRLSEIHPSNPFASRHLAERWIQDRFRVYSDLASEARAAWQEANKYLDESFRWRKELEAAGINSGNAWESRRGYAKLANDLYADAQRASYKARTYFQNLKPHFERYKQTFGSTLNLDDPQPQRELSTLQAQMRGNGSVAHSSTGTLYYERYRSMKELDPFVPKDRPTDNENEFICYVCGQRSRTGYAQGAVCRNYECPNYADPMLTLESFELWMRDRQVIQVAGPLNTKQYIQKPGTLTGEEKRQREFEAYVLDILGFPDMETFGGYAKYRGGYEGWLQDKAEWNVRQVRKAKQSRIYERLKERLGTSSCLVCTTPFVKGIDGGVLCTDCTMQAQRLRHYQERSRLWRKANPTLYRIQNPRQIPVRHARVPHLMAQRRSTYMTPSTRQELMLLAA